MTSQVTTSTTDAIVATKRRHEDKDPARSQTMELMVAIAPVVSAATSADFSRKQSAARSMRNRS